MRGLWQRVSVCVAVCGGLLISGCLDRSATLLRPVVYSDDGRHVALPLPLPSGDRLVNHSFSQSPDCHTVAIEDQEWIYLFDVDSGTSTRWTDGHNPSYAPDEQTLALVRDETLISKDVASGTETALDDLNGMLTDDSSYLTGLSGEGTGASLLAPVSFQDREPFGCTPWSRPVGWRRTRWSTATRCSGRPTARGSDPVGALGQGWID